MSGEEVVQTLKREHPLLEVIMLTGHGSVEPAVECVKSGSRHFLQNPCGNETLMSILKEAYEDRLARKLKADSKSLDELRRTVTGESSLAVLRKMKELDATSTQGM